MAEGNINAYCAICGKGYHMCNSCTDYNRIKPWRTVTDTAEHYKIYLDLHKYDLSKRKAAVMKQSKKYDLREVESSLSHIKNAIKEQLENCDLSEMESFLPHIKEAIKEILTDEISEETISVVDNEVTEDDTSTEQENIFNSISNEVAEL